MSLTRPSPTTETSTAPANSAITNPSAVTTPYIFPSSCTSLLTLCTRGPGNGVKTANFLCANTLGNRWSACQPGSTHVAVYRPAVCPSGWWAFDVGMRETGGRTGEPMGGGGLRSAEITGRTAISTARCCRGGDHLGVDLFRIYDAPVLVGGQTPTEYSRICIETWNGVSSTRFVESKVGPDGTGGDIITSIAMPSGVAYYPAWSVEWVSADLSTLSPRWPPLSNNMLIPTWTEGMRNLELYQDKGDLKPSFVPVAPDINEDKNRRAQVTRRSLTVYLPISIVLLILLGVAYWYVFKILRRRKQAEKRRRGGTWSPERLPLEVDGRREGVTGGAGSAEGKKWGGGWWWRRKRAAEKREARVVESQGLEISIR